MDVQAHRKLRLRELMDHYCGGTIATLAARIERGDSYVSRMFYPMDKPGSKPIADKMSMVIEQAFGLERAWLDQPLGYGLPSSARPVGDPLVARSVGTQDVTALPTSIGRVVWPFKRVSYQRILELKRRLDTTSAQAAIDDIDKQLEIVTQKWEQEFAPAKRPAAR